MDLVQRISKLRPEQIKLLESKLSRQGFDLSQIPISQEYRKNYEYFPLSLEQEPMWVVEKFDPNNPFYEIPGTVMLEGNLDVDLMERSINEVIKRHEILRAIFCVQDNKPVQAILPSVTIPLQRIDFKNLSEEELESRMKHLREDRNLYAFDLAKGPLVKSLLVEIGEFKYVLIIIIHHIIGDLLSLKIFLKDAASFYFAFRQGHPPGSNLAGLSFQYIDYACWAQRWYRESSIGIELREKQEKFWLEMFREEAPIINLPTDYPRPAVKSYEGDHAYFRLKSKEIEVLKESFSKENATLYIILLSIFYVFLAKICGQEDIVIGTPINTRKNTDLNNMIGLFVKTAVLRNFPQGRKTFRDFLIEVNSQVFNVYKNQDYQYEELVRKVIKERDPGHNPLFDVLFNFVYIDTSETDMPGLTVKPFRYRTNRIGFDLELICEGTYKELFLKLSYCTRLFKEETAIRFVSYIQRIIEAVVENPAVRISGIDIIPEAERKRVLIDFNNTDASYPTEKTLDEIFAEQVLKAPDSMALVGKWPIMEYRGPGTISRVSSSTLSEMEITYRELSEKSNGLAFLLREKGVEPGAIVGIMVDRCFEMLIGIMGILKAGGAYLPISPDYPPGRIDYMVKDSGAAVLLTTGDLRAPSRSLAQASFHHSSVISHHSSHLAYIIYTSGSTGKPKGVLVEHRSIINTLYALEGKYPLGKSGVYLLKTSYTFDVSVAELFGWYFGGGVLAILEKHGERDPQVILDTIETYGVTHINFVPSMFTVFVEMLTQQNNIGRLFGLRYIFLAGEALLSGPVQKFRELNLPVLLENLYGPTEASIYGSMYSLSDWEPGESIPIGKPLPNVRLYISNSYGGIQPIGIAGELCISGAGVSRGYLNRPELTAEKFIKNWSHRTYKTYIFYKTGDLARWLADGNIEYLGRIDQQVKIRGFRVELGEIENRLQRHDGVKDVVVLAKTNDKGDKYLCAYIIAGKELVIDELREFLAERLPDYMIPAYFVLLEKMPLTQSGKIDRNALPAPIFKARKAYEKPRNEMEMKLAYLWSDVLGIEKDIIGIDDNFFLLGGHSLKATVMTFRIHKEWNVRLPLADLFKAPTIRVLSEYIRGMSHERYEAIPPVEKKEYYVLSSTQKRLYILQQVELDSTAYNISEIFLLPNEATIDQLEDTFKKLINCNESLRTSFHLMGEQAFQVINKEVAFKIEYFDGTPEAAFSQFVRAFDLSKAPLLRVGFLEGIDGQNFLLIDMHHVISDGVSIGVLIRQFMLLYSGKEVPGREIQYKDFSEWRNTKEMKEAIKSQVDYWVKEFEGDIPVLMLPYDGLRPLIQSFEGNLIRFTLSKEDIEALRTYGLALGATLYMVLLAIYTVFLSKLSSQEDIVVGTHIAGRRHADLEQMIGMFVNTLALRNFPRGEIVFEQFLEEVKTRDLEANENQDYPYEELVEKVVLTRDASRNPLFDASFVLQNMDIPELEIQGLKLKPYNFSQDVAKFDLTLQCTEMADGLQCHFEYCTKLFKPDTIRRFISLFKTIVADIIENPEVKLSRLEMIPENEKEQILNDFNNTRVEYPNEKSLQRLFEDQVEKKPGHMAVVFMGSRAGGMEKNIHLSYWELNEKSNGLAYQLMQNGVGEDIIVGIKIERSLEMIIGILGILKSGGAYLPIAPDYPRERIDYMLKDSGAKLLVTTNKKEGEKARRWEGEIYYLDELLRSSYPLTFLPSDLQNSSNLAYIIYTSGSTGKPKGVMVEHRSVVNTLYALDTIYPFRESDVYLLKTAYTFDVSVSELFSWYLGGGKLAILDVHGEMDPQVIVGTVEKYGVTHINFVPSMLNVFLERVEHLKQKRLSSLKYIFCAGEVLLPNLVRKFRELNTHIPLENLYGPTEASIYSSMYSLSGWEAGRSIPIGKPLANMKLYILDNYGHLRPIGIPGELCIGGMGVSRGYLNRPGLTADKFNKDLWDYQDDHDEKNKSFAGVKGGLFQKLPLVYKTGDLARRLSDGNIEYLGRIDEQIKIRGFRIELGEIENRLLKCPGIEDAVVLAKEDESKDRYLIAYFTAAVPGKEFATEELRKFLLQYLPDYMVPSYFMKIEKIPLNPSGKLDRRALPRPGLKSCASYTAPRNKIERNLLGLWSEILGRDALHVSQLQSSIGIDDNFFELGGHSLKAIVMVSRIHKEFDVIVSLGEVFKTPFIRPLAEYIRDAKNVKYTAVQPVEKQEYYLQSSAQKRLYILQQMGGDSSVYNMPAIIPLAAEVKPGKVEEIFKKLIERHESLRTSFHMINDIPIQKIDSHVEFKIEYYGLEAVIKADDTMGIIKKFVRPFDLSWAPLLRAGLVKNSGGTYNLLVDMHHIISDELSLEILAMDFTRLYEGVGLPPLRLTYKDYSEWHNKLVQTDVIKAQEDYWLSEFSGEIPLLDMPLDYERTGDMHFEGSSFCFEIDGVLAAKVKPCARKYEVTLMMFLFSVYNILLAAYACKEEIIVGTVTAGRRHADLQNIIGFFVNMLAIKTSPGKDKTFSQYLREVKEKALNAFENQEYQFEELVSKLGIQRNPGRHPLVDVVFVFRDGTDRPGGGDRSSLDESLANTVKISHFDLMLQAIDKGHSISMTIEYSTALYKRATIEEISKVYREILEQVLENNDTRLDDIKISHDFLVARSDFIRGDTADWEL